MSLHNDLIHGALGRKGFVKRPKARIGGNDKPQVFKLSDNDNFSGTETGLY